MPLGNGHQPLPQVHVLLLPCLAPPDPTDERYLAGGAAMHFAASSARYSDGVLPRMADARVENLGSP
jgi:hypothetical protein